MITEKEIGDFLENYVEKRQILTLPDAPLYIYLLSLAKCKKRLKLRQLAVMIGEEPNQILKRLERLSEQQLIDPKSYMSWLAGGNSN